MSDQETPTEFTAEGRAAALDQWTTDNFGFLQPRELQELRKIAWAIRHRSRLPQRKVTS